MRAVQSIDRFVEDHRARWARLGMLVDRARGRVARLSAEEVLELGALYRGATSDLAVARRDFPEDAVAERLNDVVAAAHALVYSEAPASGRRLRRFVARELPAAVRAAMPFTLVAFALVVVPAAVTFAAGLIQPDVASSALSEESRRALIQRTPGTEIPEALRARIGPLIIVNNITVSIAAFAGGMTAGLYTVFILVLNGTELGTIFAVLQRAGVASSLLIFILAHGFLELSAIFLAGGAGLRLAWAILHPGDRTRRDALRLAGGQAMRVMLLVAATLVIAGLIEGFVSPTTLDPAGKLAVGLVTGIALWSYILLPYNQRFFNSR
ncbi:MAG TPA: stage II sporulation protein M [Candidatus Limnocylindria bacterium]